MTDKSVSFTVFTKPWGKKSIEELGEFIAGFGFDGIELPVRPGFQVEPDKVGEDLPRAAKALEGFGLRIGDIAAPPAGITGPSAEQTIAACGEAGIPLIRVMVQIDRSKGYMATIDALRRDFEALVPILAKHGVAIGVQNHCDYFIGSALGVMHAIEPFDPKYIQAVLDLAHCSLAGEPEEMAIDIAWPRLAMVNLKNAYRRQRPADPNAEAVSWQTYWTSGREGFASWKKTADILKKRGYSGPVCLTAEYSDEEAVDRLIADDLAYAKQLFAKL